MRTIVEQRLSFLFRALSIAFAVTGATFFLLPDGTLAFMNAAGDMMGLPPAPMTAHRFWLSLGTAYMTVVTVLAWSIAADPVGRMPMMTALAAGKAASSLTCLLYFVSYDRYFIYLANFLVDGSLVFIVLGAKFYAGKVGGAGGARVASGAGKSSGAGPSTGGLSATEKRRLAAVVEGMVPVTGASSELLAVRVEGYFLDQGPDGLTGLRVLLRFLDRAPWVTLSGFRRLGVRSVGERSHILERLEASPLFPLRLGLHAFKLVVMLHYYEDPAVQRAVGMDPDYLAAKLAVAAERRVHA